MENDRKHDRRPEKTSGKGKRVGRSPENKSNPSPKRLLLEENASTSTNLEISIILESSVSHFEESDARDLISSIINQIVPNDEPIFSVKTSWTTEEIVALLNLDDGERLNGFPFLPKTTKQKIFRKKPKVLLDAPVTDKCTVYFMNDKWKVVVGGMQGWRKTMEDAYIVLLEAPLDPSVSFFGVFDGHGGSEVSSYVSKHLHKIIMSSEPFQLGHIELAIKEGYLYIDDVLREEEIGQSRQGTTAITVMIKDEMLYCANVGDSRAIAVINGEVVPLSVDHKPMVPEEYERITEAGFFITNNRIAGGLAMSRSLGDFKYKSTPFLPPSRQPVIAMPAVNQKLLTDDWEFVVIACDGIWDVMTNDLVASFVKDNIKNDIPLNEICESLFTYCLAPNSRFPSKGCDNMTVVIILLSEDNTKITDLQAKT